MFSLRTPRRNRKEGRTDHLAHTHTHHALSHSITYYHHDHHRHHRNHHHLHPAHHRLRQLQSGVLFPASKVGFLFSLRTHRAGRNEGQNTTITHSLTHTLTHSSSSSFTHQHALTHTHALIIIITILTHSFPPSQTHHLHTLTHTHTIIIITISTKFEYGGRLKRGPRL